MYQQVGRVFAKYDLQLPPCEFPEDQQCDYLPMKEDYFEGRVGQCYEILVEGYPVFIRVRSRTASCLDYVPPSNIKPKRYVLCWGVVQLHEGEEQGIPIASLFRSHVRAHALFSIVVLCDLIQEYTRYF